MPRQLEIANALRTWGLDVIEIPGWETRGGTNFRPQGLVTHHTASVSRNRNTPSLNTVLNGRPDLPPPLCQVLQGRDGSCSVTAAGTANHAGTGDWKGLKGNETVFGLEVENDGIDEPWSDDLYGDMTRASAALLWLIGRTAEWVCGHKEWAKPKGRKPDPWGLDMNDFRADVAQLLREGPTAMPVTTDKLILPADRKLVIMELQQIYADAGFYGGAIDGDPGPYDKSLTRIAAHAMKNNRMAQIQRAEDAEALVRALREQITNLRLAGSTTAAKASLVALRDQLNAALAAL